MAQRKDGESARSGKPGGLGKFCFPHSVLVSTRCCNKSLGRRDLKQHTAIICQFWGLRWAGRTAWLVWAWGRASSLPTAASGAGPRSPARGRVSLRLPHVVLPLRCTLSRR